MGHSSKPLISYRFVDHHKYLYSFLASVVPTGRILLGMQDWGSALGFNWAYHHSDRIAGLSFFEFVYPFVMWSDLGSEELQQQFRMIRSEAGRKLVVEQNGFVEMVLLGGMVRLITKVEHDYYRAPYLEESSREVPYRWANEVPIEVIPADVYDIVETYHKWLLESDILKLFL